MLHYLKLQRVADVQIYFTIFFHKLLLEHFFIILSILVEESTPWSKAEARKPGVIVASVAASINNTGCMVFYPDQLPSCEVNI